MYRLRIGGISVHVYRLLWNTPLLSSIQKGGGMCLRVCLSVSLFVSVCVSVCLCDCLLVCVCLFFFQCLISDCLSVGVFCLCVYWYVYARLPACLSNCLSLCLPVYLSEPLFPSACLCECLYVCICVVFGSRNISSGPEGDCERFKDSKIKRNFLGNGFHYKRRKHR